MPNQTPRNISATPILEPMFNRVAWIILVFSLLITFISVYASISYFEKLGNERISARANEILLGIENRMISYETVLRGGVGLFNSTTVDRKVFANYVASLNIEEKLPGIQGIGYSIPVKSMDLEQHVASIRAEGFPEYEIRPTSEREDYSAIIYLEPFDWRNKRAFGYDMWSNEMRRKAMTRAQDKGVAANSGIITLVQETDTDVQKGFLMYLPVYEGGVTPATLEERRNKFKGWVYSPFRAENLIKGIIESQNSDFGFELYDGSEVTESALLFDSNTLKELSDKAITPSFHRFESLSSQGREWTLYVHSTPKMFGNERTIVPLLVGILGTILSLLLFWVVYTLKNAQTRTRKLVTQLDIQNKHIENKNKDLSQFAYISSHDLQEPLRTVANCADALKQDYEDKIDDEGKFLLNTMLNSTARMSSLIHAILEYSLLGKQASTDEIVDCQKVMQAVKQDLSMLIEENNATLTWTDLPIILGNQSMITQLFTNLITNAIKYTQPGKSPIISISAVSKETHYEFHVQDNGIGIESKYKDRIFQIFKRLHHSSDYTGTGIGLASCKKIVEIHHGEIWVESEVGEGSTFKFTILNQGYE